MRSAGVRFFIVGLLTCLMSIPLFLAGAIVQDRKFYAETTRTEVGREWGGPQTLGGPVLVVPVEGDVTRKERVEDVNLETGATEFRLVTRRTRERVAPLVLRPEVLDVQAVTQSDIRRRGIFEVPVYSAMVEMGAQFDTARLEDVAEEGETLLWEDAQIHLPVTNNAGLRGQASISGPAGALTFEPAGDGISAALGDLRGRIPLTIRLDVNGAERLMITPTGRDSRVTMSGDWADPGFVGAFLPDAREVTEAGFTAEWTIPHLARSMRQVTRALPKGEGLGTSFVQVNDFYQKAWRTARYGLLFIALTFLTVLLLERKDRPTHPVQYLMIGIAQCLFVLLMVSYAEQVGFAAAYLLSAGATTGLITLMAFTGLKMGNRAWGVAGALAALYGVLFLILRSTDLALLAGATLAFIALAMTMILTRNETWYGPKGPGRGIWPEKAPAPKSTPTDVPPVPPVPPVPG